MTNKKVETIYTALVSIGKTELPARLAFSVARNINILEPIFNDFVVAQQKILSTYGVQDGVDGNNFIYKFATPEDREKAMRELEELGQVDNPGVKLYKVRETQLLESLGNIPFSVANGLQYILEED